jgi:eukaryotic-like serine/threonine-protein kinase
VRFQVPLPENLNQLGGAWVSPDGQKLVFNPAGSGGLWIRNLDSLEWRLLPETQGGLAPFWSPDSRFLGFASGNDLKKIDVTGGPPQTLCQMPGPVGAGEWSTDGTILFNVQTGGPLWRVSEAGGVATAATAVDTEHGERAHAFASFLPGGKHFLYFRAGSPDLVGIYLGSLDAKPSEQSKQRLLATDLAASYANGYLFFMRGTTLMAQPFDTGKFQLKGEPVPVAENVRRATVGVGVFSVSPRGVLAYREGGAVGGNLRLTWFDRQGKAVGSIGQPGPDQGVALSPDGKRVAVRDAAQQARGDIWTLDLASGVPTRLTFRHTPGSFPVWSPDGSRIAFSAGSVPDTLFEKDSTGASEEKELYKKAGEIKSPTSWSRDGRFLLYYTVGTKTADDLWVLPIQGSESGDRKPVLLLGTNATEALGAFSPDMRWIAYASNETGRLEIFVKPFVASGPSGVPALGDGKWQISRDGGIYPHWRADGKEIIFSSPSNANEKFAVDVKTNGSAFEAGAPHQLFAGPTDSGWDISGDGKHFLMAVPAAQQNALPPITVILNWPALLKR